MRILNGIDGATGGYYTPPLSDSGAADFASATDGGSLNVLRVLARWQGQAHLGLPFDRDPKRLEEAGWCIVFHQNEDAEVKRALEPLVEHRRRQIAADRIVRTLDYRDGENVQRWLARHQVAPGSVDPTKVPLYVLVVGAPEKIPFEFGHLLDVEYCVGRLHFDSRDGYGRYAQSVIDYELGGSVPNRREAVFWAPRHANDLPTRLSADYLVKPLAEGTVVERAGGFAAQYFSPAASTKQNLLSMFRTHAPAFLFTASHGLGWPIDHPMQAAATGALLCAEFRGAAFGPVQAEEYFAASDVAADSVHGLIAFHFACFGAGTPREDRFIHHSGAAPRAIAPEAFISALPKALLSHANGGALAVIGHVERAWTSSILAPGAGVQLMPFENAIGYILRGLPVGYALKDFNERYAMLSASLAALLERRSFGIDVPDAELAQQWTERNDAEAYTLLGDPGTHLRPDALT